MIQPITPAPKPLQSLRARAGQLELQVAAAAESASRGADSDSDRSRRPSSFKFTGTVTHESRLLPGGQSLPTCKWPLAGQEYFSTLIAESESERRSGEFQ